tara:strand:- start:192 stop:710 length:519 start_codon:yes stop_codon:yes gene_type:complete
MAIKFDFNKMRTAVIGWLGGTDSSGASLSAGEQAVYVPKMRQGFQVETVNTARTLTAEDSGKIFLMNDASGGAYEITLPTAALAEEGMWFRFVQNEITPAQVITIAAGTAIIAGPLKDAGGDVGAGTAGTEVSNLVIGTSSEIGDNIEIVFVGGYYVIMSGGSSISGAITTS